MFVLAVFLGVRESTFGVRVQTDLRYTDITAACSPQSQGGHGPIKCTKHHSCKDDMSSCPCMYISSSTPVMMTLHSDVLSLAELLKERHTGTGLTRDDAYLTRRYLQYGRGRTISRDNEEMNHGILACLERRDHFPGIG